MNQAATDSVLFLCPRFPNLKVLFKPEQKQVVVENGQQTLHTLAREVYIEFQGGRYQAKTADVVAFLRNHEYFVGKDSAGYPTQKLFYESAKPDPRMLLVQQALTHPQGLDFLANQIQAQYGAPTTQTADPVASTLQQAV